MRRTVEQLHRHGVRLLLIGLVALGIVAMHHLVGPMPSGSPAVVAVGVNAQHTASDTGHLIIGDGADHDAGGFTSSGHAAPTASSSMSGDQHSPADHTLHLCLAILCAALLAVGAWLLASRRLPAALPWLKERDQFVGVPLRPPRRLHGFPLLLSLCVMRT